MGPKIDELVEQYNAFLALVKDKEVALALLHELRTDLRGEAANASRKDKALEMATDKQLSYMRKLGIPTNARISKQEAAQAIDKAVNKT